MLLKRNKRWRLSELALASYFQTLSNYLSDCNYIAMSLGCNFLNIFEILLFSMEFTIFQYCLVAVSNLFHSSTFLQFFIFLLRYASNEITVDQVVWFNATTSAQARRQDSVIGGGAEINFGGA